MTLLDTKKNTARKTESIFKYKLAESIFKYKLAESIIKYKLAESIFKYKLINLLGNTIFATKVNLLNLESLNQAKNIPVVLPSSPIKI